VGGAKIPVSGHSSWHLNPQFGGYFWGSARFCGVFPAAGSRAGAGTCFGAGCLRSASTDRNQPLCVTGGRCHELA